MIFDNEIKRFKIILDFRIVHRISNILEQKEYSIYKIFTKPTEMIMIKT